MKLYLPITVDLYNAYPLSIMNVQQNNIGRGALVTLTAAGQVVVPTKESLYVYAKKQDGTMVYATCTMSGSQIKIDYDEQMTAVPGTMTMELQMVDASGNSITTPIFMINVQPSNINYRQITSSDEFLALVDALNQVDSFQSQINALNEKLIPFDFYVPSGSDINDPEFSKFGFYSGANLVNAPTASWFQWFTFPLNGNPNYPAQLGFTIERGNTRIFTRGTLIEGSSKVWADWVEYITKTYADNMFKIIEKSSESFSVPQNSNFGTEIVVPIPSGYKYVCIIDVWSASMNIVSTNRWLDSGTGEEVKIKVNGRNVSDQGVDVFRVHVSVLVQKL